MGRQLFTTFFARLLYLCKYTVVFNLKTRHGERERDINFLLTRVIE